jgi:hypothetical protein
MEQQAKREIARAVVLILGAVILMFAVRGCYERQHQDGKQKKEVLQTQTYVQPEFNCPNGTASIEMDNGKIVKINCK